MQRINRLGALLFLFAALLFPAAVRAGNAFEVPTNYPNIQRAMDLAPPGATIIISPGTFNEDVVIAPNKTFTISSEAPNDPAVVKSFTVGANSRIEFDNLIIGGPGPAYPVRSIDAAAGADITVNGCVTHSAFRFDHCAKVQIHGAQMPGRLSVPTILCDHVPLVTISGSTITGGEGYAGQCNGTIAALPQDGNPAIYFRSCHNATVQDCILRGGIAGELTSGDNCQAHLPIIAHGGSSIEEDGASIVFRRNTLVTGGLGNPPGAAVDLHDTSQYFDDSACGWQTR